MERVLALLPGPQPAVVRYGVSIALVILTFAVRLGIENRAGSYGFILFIPAVILAALLFDRGSGLLALTLSTILIAAVTPWHADADLHLAAIAIYLIVGTAVVFISEGLHRALVTAQKAEREQALLLEEMSHRVKNKFSMILSVLGIQARQSGPDVQAALDNVARRVRVIASIHDHLQLARERRAVNIAISLREICGSLEDAMRELQPVGIVLEADPVMLPPEKALAVGLTVNELVTNAFKYAFPDDRAGHIHVRFVLRSGRLELTVADDGIGCDVDPTPGVGSKLVNLLVAQLDGTFARERTAPGCKVSISFPACRRK